MGMEKFVLFISTLNQQWFNMYKPITINTSLLSEEADSFVNKLDPNKVFKSKNKTPVIKKKQPSQPAGAQKSHTSMTSSKTSSLAGNSSRKWDPQIWPSTAFATSFDVLQCRVSGSDWVPCAWIDMPVENTLQHLHEIQPQCTLTWEGYSFLRLWEKNLRHWFHFLLLLAACTFQRAWRSPWCHCSIGKLLFLCSYSNEMKANVSHHYFNRPMLKYSVWRYFCYLLWKKPVLTLHAMD